MEGNDEGFCILTLPSASSIDITQTVNHVNNNSFETNSNTFLHPTFRFPTASLFLHERGHIGNDRFSTPNTRLFFNEKNELTHRVKMETTSWQIELQTSSRLKEFITTNSTASNTQHWQMTDLYQIWNMSASPVEFCVGIFKFEKNTWDNLVFRFCDLGHYMNLNSAKILNAGNPFTTKDLKRLGAVSEPNTGSADSYLNDDIINTITADILQPFTKKALYLSTHYHTFIRTMISKHNLSNRDITLLLRWGKKSGKDATHILMLPSSTAIIHLNSNHW